MSFLSRDLTWLLSLLLVLTFLCVALFVVVFLLFISSSTSNGLFTD